MEYRIPIAGPVMFSFFDDFGIDAALNKGQLKQSPEGFASLTAPLYGCPVYNNGACQGGIPGSQVGFQQDIRPVSGTNFVPAHVRWAAKSRSSCRSSTRPSGSTTPTTRCACMSARSATTCSTRQQQSSCSAQLITRDLFPPGGAGDYTYGEAMQAYGARYLFREPRKTFRLTVSTTF